MDAGASDAADVPEADASDADVADGAAPDGALTPLMAAAGEARYALVGEVVVLDGSGSTGAAAYQWDPGNGDAPAPPSAEPTLEVSYDSPGRYRPTLTIFDAEGTTRRDDVVISVTERPSHTRRHSDTLTWLPENFVNQATLAVVVPDNDTIVFITEGPEGWARTRTLETCDNPRSVTAWVSLPERPQVSARLAVACPDEDAIDVFSLLDEARVARVTLPPGSRPFGVVAPEGRGGAAEMFATLQGTGQIVHLRDDSLNDDWRVEALVEVAPDLRGVALLPDGRVAMSRWRSLQEPEGGHGEIWVWNPEGESAPEMWPLAFDPQAASDTEIGGLPTYLDHLEVSPQGHEMAVPSLQANAAHGSFTSGEPSAPDEVLRAVVSFVDLEAETERFDARKQFDGRGMASSATFTARGDYLFVAMRGSQTIERLDRFSENQSGTLLDSGFAVEGLVLSANDDLLFANATLSRAVKIYAVDDLTTLPVPIAEVPLVDEEPLGPTLLLGKQLFNDSADPRLGFEGYIACAHCHLDGDSDHLTWDFSDRGEGLRQTISLFGRSETGHGPIHWSGNFDEGQDFEHDLRGPFGGLGLMSDAEFSAEGRDAPLGAPKAGVNADLDALAAYMASLDTHIVSPHRTAEGALTPLAERGKDLFFSEAVGCGECHPAPLMTDSSFQEDGSPLLHDVGTLKETSGQRLGGPLPGIDTPTLHGLWHSAPYLHDGSAPSLMHVLTVANPDGSHGETADLTTEEFEALEAYLLSLDGRWE